MRTFLLLAAWGAVQVGGAAGAAAGRPRSPTPAEAEFVERHVRPVLAENCVRCHGPKKQMGGLRLDGAEGLRKGGDNGPVLEPGDPDASPLVRAVRHAGPLKMPPKKRLKEEDVRALAAWVRM